MIKTNATSHALIKTNETSHALIKTNKTDHTHQITHHKTQREEKSRLIEHYTLGRNDLIVAGSFEIGYDKRQFLGQCC
jgi:hypothetical protein